MSDPLVLAGRAFASRLIVGTGKYKDVAEAERAIDASGAEIVTVALRRVDLSDRSSGSLMSLLARKNWVVLPNTAGCYTADEAVRTLRLARELGLGGERAMVKLEVIGDPKTLYPDKPLDQPGRPGGVPGGHRVPHRVIGQLVLLVPGCRVPVQLGTRPGCCSRRRARSRSANRWW